MNRCERASDSKSLVAFRVIAKRRWLIGRLVSKLAPASAQAPSGRSSAHNVSRLVSLAGVRSTAHDHGGEPIGRHERGKLPVLDRCLIGEPFRKQ